MCICRFCVMVFPTNCYWHLWDRYIFIGTHVCWYACLLIRTFVGRISKNSRCTPMDCCWIDVYFAIFGYLAIYKICWSPRPWFWLSLYCGQAFFLYTSKGAQKRLKKILLERTIGRNDEEIIYTENQATNDLQTSKAMHSPQTQASEGLWPSA